MQGEGKRFSVWISLLIAGKHDGGYSMEGDGLCAEGEFFVCLACVKNNWKNVC